MVKWHVLLKPVLQNLTLSAQGKPNLEWWSRVCSQHGNGSGPRYLSGWITSFCVFNENGKWVGDQVIVKSWGQTCSSACDLAPEGWPIINTNDIPVGSVRVDVTVDDNGTLHKTVLSAGFMSVMVFGDNNNNTVVAPCLDWALHLKN